MGSSFIWLRRMIKGVTWKHPLIVAVLIILDPLDAVIRFFRGTGRLPRMSVRVRSTGIRNEFGGRQYHEAGQFFCRILKDLAGLRPESDVLEIGCGSGRAALALTDFLDRGTYTGMDIETVSLNACRRNRTLKRRGYRFDLMDIYSEEYNPGGRLKAEEYAFDYPDASFDVIFMTSVFTHMLPGAVSNYIAEIGRMLRPGGRCLFTTFVMDAGTEGYGIAFPYNHVDYCLFQEHFPEKAVGYFLHYLDREFGRVWCRRTGDPVLGPWRDVETVIEYPKTDFAQDIVVYEKG
ncbi:class I SAM-dependent methyltransferase [bacterium]|nr:class I SAM-dependent methyltransferase [bacterium]